MAKSAPKMKRLESKKSHSWWWDSHISPKNSKWLEENLEDMDQSIKRMLKLIEDDGDSFAKKAEMYYQRRPELVSNVEEFYRMYRSLAERYDNLTGELRNSIQPDLKSQSSGISEGGSELTTPERRASRRNSDHRAAGFKFFLGSGGGSPDTSRKEGDDIETSSSSSSSESESDGALSRNNSLSPPMNGEGEGLRRRIVELEGELVEMKEKLRVSEEDNSDAQSPVNGNGNYEELLGRITWYEEELKVANERLRVSEEDIRALKAELESQKVGFEANLSLSADKITALENELRIETEKNEVDNVETIYITEPDKIEDLEARILDQEQMIKTLEEESKIRNEEIGSIKQELDSSLVEIEMKEVELKLEKKQISDLELQIKRLQNNVSDGDQEVSKLNETISTFSTERSQLETKIITWESTAAYLEDEIKRVESEKTGEIERLNKSFDGLKLKYDMLVAERDDLNAKVNTLKAEISSRDEHLHRLHMEHVGLISAAEAGKKLVEELKARLSTVEEEVERQKVVISDGAEEKREAIRQLCFSIEHYRSGYQELREAVFAHKRPAVLAA
ncbi:hypothetical protein ACHQM5_021929 [Ranunculus cassubicifolius]